MAHTYEEHLLYVSTVMPLSVIKDPTVNENVADLYMYYTKFLSLLEYSNCCFEYKPFGWDLEKQVYLQIKPTYMKTTYPHRDL